jgi:hypothetical protein
VKVYNNTSYWNPASDAAALAFDADFTGNNPNIFKNNIIYSDHPWLVRMKSDSLECDNNIYWSTKGKPLWVLNGKKYYSFSEWQKATGMEANSQYVDPRLKKPNYHGNARPTSQFRPKSNSPAIDAGVDVGNMGDHDFFGNPVPGADGSYDIGAYETQ